MKNMFIASTTLWLCTAACATSQKHIALKGGLNAATQEHANRDNRYGFSGGLEGHLQHALSDRLSFGGQLELLYTPRGADATFQGQPLGTVRQHYADVVLAVRPALQLNAVNLYLLLGGGLNLLMSASKADASGDEQDITGDLHRIDVALLGGAGVSLHLPDGELGPLHLGAMFLEVRHDIGLLDTDAVNGGFKNRTSSVMLGLSFELASGPPAASPTQSALLSR